MNSHEIALIGFMEQDNLGIGYIASALIDAGFTPNMFDFRLDPSELANHVRNLDPIAVGFSIIFQNSIDQFKELIGGLRNAGIHSHFSAGGHYPSLRYQEVLESIPTLDSIVRFEGEITFVELVQALSHRKPWIEIAGLAYRDGQRIVATTLRPLEQDLDNFTPPVRPPLRPYALGKNFATLLAGRGCHYNCSFCSIRAFYSTPPGQVKRLRRPEYVVREMQLLNEQKQCSVFMFQDDDFPVAGATGRKWIDRFCGEIDHTGLNTEIMWKINCRPDEVQPETFARMKTSGLFLVYLGIESGTDAGLQLMNKHSDVMANHRAVKILKTLNIDFDYGFMLFDPSSTISSVLENLTFLDEICGDGSSPITFCKMMPYVETKIEADLRQQGRLLEEMGRYDYTFIDPRIDGIYDFMADAFGTWIGDHDGLLNIARWARYCLAVFSKYHPGDNRFDGLRVHCRESIAYCNRFFVETSRGIVEHFTTKLPKDKNWQLRNFQRQIEETHDSYCQRFQDIITTINQWNAPVLSVLPIKEREIGGHATSTGFQSRIGILGGD